MPLRVDVRSIVERAVSAALDCPVERVEAGKSLRQLGADGLDGYEIAREIEEMLGGVMPIEMPVDIDIDEPVSHLIARLYLQMMPPLYGPPAPDPEDA